MDDDEICSLITCVCFSINDYLCLFIFLDASEKFGITEFVNLKDRDWTVQQVHNSSSTLQYILLA